MKPHLMTRHRKIIAAFGKSLWKQWALLSALSLVSTAVTFIVPFAPKFVLPRLIILWISLPALLVALYRVFAEQYEKIGDMGSEILALQAHAGALQICTETSDRLRDELEKLEKENLRLKVKPYDGVRLSAAQANISGFNYLERDFLRFLLLQGEARTDVIFQARTRQDVPFDVNALNGPLKAGFVTRTENHTTGLTLFSMNPSWANVLRDILFPRTEAADRLAVFQGIG